MAVYCFSPLIFLNYKDDRAFLSVVVEDVDEATSSSSVTNEILVKDQVIGGNSATRPSCLQQLVTASTLLQG